MFAGFAPEITNSHKWDSYKKQRSTYEMFRNKESRRWASIQGTTESHPVDTTNQSDSPHIEKADTNSSSSSYATGNGSEIRETITPIVIPLPTPPTPSTPPPPPPPPPPLPSTFAWSASSIRGSPADPTYGTQIRETGFIPFSRTNPINPVVPQGSQQFPLQYPQESYRTQIPQTYPSRTYGNIPASRTPQQFVLQSVPPQPFGLSPPVLITGGTFTPGFGHVPPSPSSLRGYNPIVQVVQPQTSGRRVDAFVASDPFRVSHGDDKVDAPSDGLTFDDIPTAVSDQEHNFPQGYYDFLPQSIVPVPQRRFRRPRRPSRSPEPRARRRAYRMRYGFRSDDSSDEEDGLAEPHSPRVRPEPLTPVSSPSMQSQAPASAFSYSPVPSAQRSSIIGPKSDDRSTTPFSTVLDPPLDSRYEIPSSPHESQTTTDEGSRRPYRPFPPPPQPIPFHYFGFPDYTGYTGYTGYTDYTNYTGYPQHYFQYPELTKDSYLSRFFKFVLVTLPTQMYLHCLLLRLPSLYFSRVARIFEEADMTLPEIKKMALETASQGLKHEFEIQMAFESSSVSSAYKRLKSTWESFIDSVMREWKTFNIISVLLLTYVSLCLYTMLVPTLISC